MKRKKKGRKWEGEGRGGKVEEKRGGTVKEVSPVFDQRTLVPVAPGKKGKDDDNEKNNQQQPTWKNTREGQQR